jgi:carbon-monoxide dehydrogenase small subunit/xanthine dehydrogenase small subunit
VCACLVPFAQARDAEVLTIEGLHGDHPLQHAFVTEGGAQCGMCTPGMILAAMALGPRPSIDKMRVGLAGNLCRCTGYEAIYRSIERAWVTDGRKGGGSEVEGAEARGGGG